jgi:DNA repair exonuclease SbcCD nuclease subunit
MLLTADLHLTDRPQDEYRWNVFADMQAWLKEPRQQQAKENYIIIAGDLVDTKDRFSANFVNRLTRELRALTYDGVSVWITRGNHDTPISGTPYWNFLSYIPGIYYIDTPWLARPDLLLLPYSPDPLNDWKGLDWKPIRCAILHQCLSGAVSNSGFTLTNDKMPILPRGKVYYAGDIHTPQKVGTVQYIGAPHPINYGDQYTCRMLDVDDISYAITSVIDLHPPMKHMITDDMQSWVDGVPAFSYALTGDQAKVRIQVPLNMIEQWPVVEQKIKDWAIENAITVASIEPIIVGAALEPESTEVITDPVQIFADFIGENDLSPAIVELGISILENRLKAAP